MLYIPDGQGGLRFCQQCTKLEPVSAFDEEKRSCRASLLRRKERRTAVPEEQQPTMPRRRLVTTPWQQPAAPQQPVVQPAVQPPVTLTEVIRLLLELDRLARA